MRCMLESSELSNKIQRHKKRKLSEETSKSTLVTGAAVAITRLFCLDCTSLTEMDSTPDLLTDLPSAVIDNILALLPIRDAVKTSILSSRWRYRWATLPHLVFDDNCVNSSAEKTIAENNLIKSVTRALFLHRGPIHKFKLSASFLHSCPDIDQWLLFLSRNEIRELSLELAEGNLFRMPSCLFSFPKLTCLELYCCELHPPPDFKGFLTLRTLIFHDVSVLPGSLESLISSCPLLENLTLSYSESTNMNIAAPNLKYLCLEGDFEEISLNYMPHLTEMSITLYMNDEEASERLQKSSISTLSKILGCVPNIERLAGDVYSTKYLGMGITNLEVPLDFLHLEVLELYQVNFSDIQEILVVLSLTMRAPNLCEFHVSVSSDTLVELEGTSVVWFLNTLGPSKYAYQKLEVIKVTDFLGTPEEIQYIKFVLPYAPALQKLIIEPSQSGSNERLNMLIELLKIKRASPHAEILFINV